jgi:hypothetical protein
MRSRLGGFLPRIIFFVVVIVLATATLTLAAQRRATYTAPKTPAVTPPVVMRVPDVTGQAYVFAKGVLEDAGFAWRVGSGAPGYAGYKVKSQSPAPGTRVIDNGAPTIVLHIAADPHYVVAGHSPQDESPYAGKAIQLARNPVPVVRTIAPKAVKPKAKPPATKPVATKPVTPKTKPVAPKTKPVTPKAPARAPARTPAFVVAGAPKEPLDEITLTARAQQLATWVAAHPSPSTPNVKHWLYQHTWIVTGARFGWSNGSEALKILIGVDQTVERQWAMGSKSEAEARAALSYVASKSR